MQIKYEFRRAFSRPFVIALFIGISSGIVGIIPYYLDTQWNDPAAVSCYDAWLYCLSVSEVSIYRAIFPIIISLPYLTTLHTDRNSGFIFFITSRTSYSRYLKMKIGVGLVSALSVIFLTLVFWLCACMVIFPINLPTTVFNYLPKGVFSQYFVLQPLKYILIIILLNLVSGALFFLLFMGISFSIKNRYLVILTPFIVYLFFIIISQSKVFFIFDPIPLIVPLEAPSTSLAQIILKWLIILILCLTILYRHYITDDKEIL